MIVPVKLRLISLPEMQLSRQPNPFHEPHLFPTFRTIRDNCRVGRLWFLKIHTNSWIPASQPFRHRPRLLFRGEKTKKEEEPLGFLLLRTSKQRLLHSYEIAGRRVRPWMENVHRLARQRVTAHAIMTAVAAEPQNDRPGSVIQREERIVGTRLSSSKRLSVDCSCSLDARGNVVGGSGLNVSKALPFLRIERTRVAGQRRSITATYEPG